MTEIKNFPEHYGPWALIVGASTGLGAAWAEEAAKRGMNVAICARRAEKLEDVAAGLRERYGVETRQFVVDISDEGAADVILAQTTDLDLGLCIYNAAIEQAGLFVDTAEQRHIDQVTGNALNPMRLTYHLSREMAKKHRGAILLISSMAGVQGTANQASYSASKAFMAMLGESLWNEMARFGVRVATVTVGAVATPEYLRLAELHADPNTAAAEASGPQPHTPEEVAAYVMEHLEDGPRLFSHPDDEAAFTAMSQLPRAMAVNMISAATDQYFSAGHTQLEPLPQLPKSQWI